MYYNYKVYFFFFFCTIVGTSQYIVAIYNNI